MKKYVIAVGTVTAVLFVLSFIPAVCDIYAETVYGLISDALGFFFGAVPVNIGECLMYLGTLAVVGCVISGILFIFLRKKTAYRRFFVKYVKMAGCTAVTILLVYMLNWWLPIRSTLMGGAVAPAETTTLDELESLRAYFVGEINSLAGQVERDSEGKLIYPDEERVRSEVSAAMKNISPEYKRLSGYYPPIKSAYCSDVLDWMGIGGYTYPYTMELTYNEYITKLFYPALFAHESAHHQGYYRENEGNFIEFVGCISSEDPFIRYSAYIDIYRYVHGAYVMTLISEYPDNWKERAKLQPKLSEQVHVDESEAFNEAVERYEEDSHPLESYEVVEEAVEEAADVMWEKQGEILGSDCYDGVVPLLLTYYRKQGVLS